MNNTKRTFLRSLAFSIVAPYDILLLPIIQGGPKKTIPFKNAGSFVVGEHFFLKICTPVEEIFLHIRTKFCEEISNKTKVMVLQRKKFKFTTQPAMRFITIIIVKK